MPVDIVAEMLTRSLTAIENQYGPMPKAAAVAADGAWWFATVALDRGRPPSWLRSQERTQAVTTLAGLRDKFVADLYAAAEAPQI